MELEKPGYLVTDRKVFVRFAKSGKRKWGLHLPIPHEMPTEVLEQYVHIALQLARLLHPLLFYCYQSDVAQALDRIRTFLDLPFISEPNWQRWFYKLYDYLVDIR